MHSSQDLPKIKALVNDLLPIVENLILKGNGSIPLDALLIEVTGKPPMVHEQDLSVQSMHGVVLLNNIGEELALSLRVSHPHKNFRVLSIWGRSPALVVSDK